MLENSAQSWYDAGYINVRRRYTGGLTFLANYTWSKSLTDAPDFRSPMFESSIPQNNSNLAAEKGPGCDIRHRFALSAVYDIPRLEQSWRPGSRDSELAAVDCLSGADRVSVHHFGVWRHGQLGHGSGREPDPRQLSRASPSSDQARAPPTSGSIPRLLRHRRPSRSEMWAETRSTDPECRRSTWQLTRVRADRERIDFQFRAEFFNALNHTNLGTPNRFVNTPQFGTITEATTPGREIQLSARLSF